MINDEELQNHLKQRKQEFEELVSEVQVHVDLLTVAIDLKIRWYSFPEYKSPTFYKELKTWN